MNITAALTGPQLVAIRIGDHRDTGQWLDFEPTHSNKVRVTHIAESAGLTRIDDGTWFLLDLWTCPRCGAANQDYPALTGGPYLCCACEYELE